MLQRLFLILALASFTESSLVAQLNGGGIRGGTRLSSGRKNFAADLLQEFCTLRDQGKLRTKPREFWLARRSDRKQQLQRMRLAGNRVHENALDVAILDAIFACGCGDLRTVLPTIRIDRSTVSDKPDLTESMFWVGIANTWALQFSESDFSTCIRFAMQKTKTEPVDQAAQSIGSAVAAVRAISGEAGNPNVTPSIDLAAEELSQRLSLERRAELLFTQRLFISSAQRRTRLAEAALQVATSDRQRTLIVASLLLADHTRQRLQNISSDPLWKSINPPISDRNYSNALIDILASCGLFKLVTGDASAAHPFLIAAERQSKATLKSETAPLNHEIRWIEIRVHLADCLQQTNKPQEAEQSLFETTAIIERFLQNHHETLSASQRKHLSSIENQLRISFVTLYLSRGAYGKAADVAKKLHQHPGTRLPTTGKLIPGNADEIANVILLQNAENQLAIGCWFANRLSRISAGQNPPVADVLELQISLADEAHARFLACVDATTRLIQAKGFQKGPLARAIEIRVLSSTWLLNLNSRASPGERLPPTRFARLEQQIPSDIRAIDQMKNAGDIPSDHALRIRLQLLDFLAPKGGPMAEQTLNSAVKQYRDDPAFEKLVSVLLQRCRLRARRGRQQNQTAIEDDLEDAMTTFLDRVFADKQFSVHDESLALDLFENAAIHHSELAQNIDLSSAQRTRSAKWLFHICTVLSRLSAEADRVRAGMVSLSPIDAFSDESIRDSEHSFRDRMDSDTVTLAYLCGDRKTVLLAMGTTVSQDGWAAYECAGRYTIDDKITSLMDELLRAPDGRLISTDQFQSQIDEIAELLIPSALREKLAGGSPKVDILTDRPISRLPFAVLWNGQKSQPSVQQIRFTADDASVLANSEPLPNSHHYIGLGISEFGKAFELMLENAEDEIRWFANELTWKRSEFFLGSRGDANRQNLENAIQRTANQPFWLHIATHGFETQRKTLGGVRLQDSRQASRFQDWTTDHFSKLPLSNCVLAILCTCRSSASPGLREFGDQFSLASAAIDAGAAKVIASRWDVDDEAALLLMKRFCNGVRRGQSIRDAWNHALTALRESNDFSDPHFWAPFELISRQGRR